MRKPLVYIILSALFLVLFFLQSGAQTTFKNQDELKTKADEYFTAEDYTSAMPLYSQLVSIYPKDPTYNYRFGVCLLYADRRDNEKPIKYLEFASSKDGVDDAVFYYLGLAYHENYRFADAIKEYTIYKDKAASKSVAKLDVVRQIEICKNAMTLLSSISDLYVLQKTEVVTSDFFRSYDVERFGGKILVKPDIFKTPLDKKKEKFSLCFFSKENNEVYFSSYGKDGKNGKDIYKSTKQKDGTWSKPENLGTTINTPYDEDFPFLLPDGSTLYFSSKGSNTIGGYDIFTSTLNENGTWSTPENLNYPINTPFDDIMFVPDSSGKYAYFSSERSSMEGMITVYRVRIDTRSKIEEQLVFNKSDVSQENDSAYKQTLQFLKEKSSLDVNATESMFKEKDQLIADNTNDQADTSDESDVKDNMSNQDIINLAEKQAVQSQKELADLKTKRQAAWTIATNRKTQSEKKYKEAETVTNNAQNLADEDAKKTQLSKASTLQSEAEQLNKEAVIATNIASQLDKQVAAKQKESDEAAKYAKDIKTAVQSNSTDSSIAMLERMTEKLQNSATDTSSYENNPNEDYIQKKADEAENLYTQSKALQEEINSLNDQAANYKKKADNTKKKSEKVQYLQQANDYEAEAKTKQSELDVILQKTEKVQYEGDSAKSQSDIYASLVEDIQNNNTTSVSSTNNQMTAANTNTNSNQTNNTSSTNATSSSNTSTNNQTTVNNSNQNIASTNTNTNNQTTANNTNSANKTGIITQADKVVTSINASLDSMKKQADNAYNLAYNYNEQSLKKQKEADNLKADASETANTDEKEKYLKKADELDKESVELARKAVVAYSLAEYYDENYTKKKQESSTVTTLVQKVKDNANSGNLNDAQNALTQAKTEQTKFAVSETADQYKSELSNSLDSKQYEAEQAQEDADRLQKKADSLSTKAKDLRTQANNTKKQSQKNELITQAEQAEQQLNTAQKDANTALDKVDAINEEVTEMKTKVNYSNSLVNETEIYVKPANTTIDKATLEKNITQYENNNVFAENATSTKENSSATNNTSNTASNNTNVVANNTTNTNTQNSTNTNVATNNNTSTSNNNTNSTNSTNNNTAANNTNASNTNSSSSATMLTNPQQLEQKADVIDQAIVTIRTRIKALQSGLTEVTDENDKADINKEIAQLQKELTELQDQSDKTHTEAKENNNSEEVTTSNIDYTTLSNNLENEANNDLDNATELRKEANNTTNQAVKDSLRKDASLLEKTAENKNIESLEIKNLGNTNDYYSNSLKADSMKKNTANNAQTSSAESMLNESKYYFDKAQALKKTINDSMSYNEKKSVYNDVLSNEKSAIDKQQKAIEIYKQVSPTYANNSSANNSTSTNSNTSVNTNNTTNTGNNNNVVTNNTNTDTNSTAVNNSNANTNNTAVNNTSNTTANNSSTGNTITPNDFKGIYLDANNNMPLNVDAANLVPLDPSMPAGVVFKVQFCALNKHVSPDVFTGITPVTGESTTFGICRYLAGLFAKYDDAVAARDLIRPKGYADAFVVAYNNGKRITVGEALALLKSDNSLTTTYAELNNKSYVSSGNANTTAGNTATTAALSNPVSKISGLFYSVQVGVYVKPVTSAQLFNITPLYDEVMANGYYRYLSGTYANLQDAVAAKNTIVTKGVTDAFVVVYYNGKKITFADAKTLQAGNTNLTITNDNSTTANTTNNTNTAVTNNGIVFKVQVGAYHKELTNDQVTQYLGAAVDKGLEHSTNEYGLVVYTSGNFTDYKSASDYKNTLVGKGLTDAYIVAFNGKEKIAVNKAIELLK